jgi:hypothetical protein
MRRRRILTPAECLSGAPVYTPRGADGIGIGIGIGLPFGGRRSAWTPEKLVQPGDSWLWADLDATGAVKLNTQPPLVDGDMEAVGVGAWVPNNAILTKEAGSPSGIGSQVLRVKRAGSSSFARQIIKIVGNYYVVTGYARGDGSNAPAILRGNGFLGGMWAGTKSTIWQTISGEGIELYGTDFVLYAGAVDTHWTEYDDLNLRNLSVNSVTCKGNLGNLVQATEANMPWLSDADAPTSVRLNTKRVLYSDGVADHSVSSGAASTHSYHKAAGFTYTEVIRPDTAAAGTDTLIDTCDAAAANVGITVEYDATNTQIVVKVANASGTFVVEEASGAGTVPKAAWTRVAVSWSAAAGVIIRTDEDAPVTAASVGAASAADATATLQFGRTSGGANYFHGGRCGMLLKTGAQTSDNLGKWLAWAKTEYAL